jgi:hypothetical protein
MPAAASLRIELTRYLVLEGEWLQPMSASSFFDSGDIGLTELNGETGIYGRHTSAQRWNLRMNSVTALGRTSIGRFSFLAGGGFGLYRMSTHRESTRTGCTGPWVRACENENWEFDFDDRGLALLLVGGLDVNLLPRIDAFVTGRIGGSNAFEEAAVVAGVRATVVSLPGRRRAGPSRAARVEAGGLPLRAGEEIFVTHEDGTEERGEFIGSSGSSVTFRTAAREVTAPLARIRLIEVVDPITNGLGWGLLTGAGVGVIIATFDEPRTIPASVLIGGAVGAMVDALGRHRDVVFNRSRGLQVATHLAPSAAAVRISYEWR